MNEILKLIDVSIRDVKRQLASQVAYSSGKRPFDFNIPALDGLEDGQASHGFGLELAPIEQLHSSVAKKLSHMAWSVVGAAHRAH